MDIFQIVEEIKEFFVSIKEIFTSPVWQDTVFLLKFIFLFISVLLFIGIVALIIRLNVVPKIKEATRLLAAPTHLPRKLGKKWAKIEQRLKSGQDAELKLAVIEADKFFDDVLKKVGFFGKDMGERLKRINSSQIANIDDIWQAHKARNNIVHDVDYKLTELEAERAVKSYKKALEELEVL